MASLATRELKIGKIVDKTLGVLERCALPAALFVVVVTALSVAISYLTFGSTSVMRLLGGEFLKSAIGIVGSYFLLIQMVRRTGLRSRTDEEAFLPFIGLSLLSALGVMLGMIAFVIPGLFVMARWSIAQPLLIASGTGVMASLRESWERTRGNEFQIIVAGLALVVLLMAVGIASAVLFEQGDPVRMALSQLASTASSVVLLAMGVALYGIMLGSAAAAPPAG